MSKNILIVLLPLMVWAPFQSAGAGALNPKITVYKSRFCGCCKNWSRYLGERGFIVTEKPVEHLGPLKKKFGIPRRFSACHTATAGGYVIEGHVPLEDIKRLLHERPDIRGLAVRGMPKGAPGMEGAAKKGAFKVMAIRKDGTSFVYSTHRAE